MMINTAILVALLSGSALSALANPPVDLDEFFLANNTSIDEEYDFAGLEGDLVISDEDEVSLKEAATSLLLAEIEQLKNKTWEKETEIEELHSQIEAMKALFAQEKEALAHESKRQEEALIEKYENEKSSLKKESENRTAGLVEDFKNEKAGLVEEWKNEKAALIRERNQTVENLEKSKSLEKSKCEKVLTNKGVLIRFLSYRLKDKDKRAKISRVVIEAQNEKLRILGEERKTYQEKNKMFLKQAYLQADEIMRQEQQKKELKDALEIEAVLRQDFCNLTELLKGDTVENFPQYVGLLAKTLTDQTEEINKLR